MTAAVIDMAMRNQYTRNFPEFSNDKEKCHWKYFYVVFMKNSYFNKIKFINTTTNTIIFPLLCIYKL